MLWESSRSVLVNGRPSGGGCPVYRCDVGNRRLHGRGPSPANRRWPNSASQEGDRSDAVSRRTIGRRSFLVRAGRGVLGVAVLGLAGCSADDGRVTPAPGAQRVRCRTGLVAGRPGLRVGLRAGARRRGGRRRHRRRGERGPDRGGARRRRDGWDGVRAVVITHAHFDHSEAWRGRRPRGRARCCHAGAADLEWFLPAARWSPGDRGHARRMHAVVDGDEVFGLQVVATPGHTPGHVAVFDPDSGVLVAGDALTNTIDGVLSGFAPGGHRGQGGGRRLGPQARRAAAPGHPGRSRSTAWNGTPPANCAAWRTRRS